MNDRKLSSIGLTWRFLRRLREDTGSSIVFTALGLVVIIGFAALAVDLGMLFGAHSEAQRAADAGARAGAYELISAPNDAQRARDTAIHVAESNVVRGEMAEVYDSDVTVDLAERTVRVVVRRNSARGNAFSGFFAGIFGIDELGVGVDATAKVWSATSGKCLLPTAIPDRWMEDENENGVIDDGEGPAGPNDTYDSDTGDCWDCDGDGEGDATYSVGESITIYPGQGSQSSFEPGWWYLWNPSQEQGASQMKDWVTTCPDGDAIWGPGNEITDKNGSNTSIVREFDRLIDQDRNAQWDGSKVVNSDYSTSPRLRPVILFNPDTYQKVGNEANFTISNVAGVFITGTTGNQVNAVFTPFPGLTPTDDPDEESFAKMVRLIE